MERVEGDAPGDQGPFTGSEHDERVMTLGIDLATTNGSTGLCWIDWHARTSTVRVGNPSDAELIAAISRVRAAGGWVAIDAPFGFPDAFSDAVARWREMGRVEPTTDALTTRRITDVEVARRQQGLKAAIPGNWVTWPLSAVVERITPTVLRAAQILTGVSDGPVDRVGLGSRVVETYPIAALRAWDIPTHSYKSNDADARSVLMDLCRRTGVERPDGLDDVKPRRLDDAVDAFVCALVARVVATSDGRTGPAQDSTNDLATVEREGWIHLPPEDHPLERLR